MLAIHASEAIHLQPDTRIAYYHFTDCTEVFTGTISAVIETRFGRRALVQPDKREDMSLCQKWVCWNAVVSYIWQPEPVEPETEILDTEYDSWLDFLAANAVLNQDTEFFDSFVQDVEDSDSPARFQWALSRLENAVADWRDGAR